MSDKTKQWIYTILSIVVILLYIIGIVIMICGTARDGINLWVISTVLGALLLYVRKTQAKKKADAEAEEAEELERLEKEKNS